MNRSVLIGTGLAALVIIGGVLGWLLLNKTTAPSTNQNSSSNTATDSGAIDKTATAEVAVDMKNTKFSPASIKVKKGAKVTWTNQDSVRHNVVADDFDNAAGLPTQNALLGKGESYSFTFNTVGTFSYHCTPHPFMTGTVEVVE